MTRGNKGGDGSNRPEESRRIGSNMRKRRLALKISQTSVAHALGVSQAQIVKYEKGQSEIPASKLRTLCSMLETDANYLLGCPPDTDDLPSDQSGGLSS